MNIETKDGKVMSPILRDEIALICQKTDTLFDLIHETIDVIQDRIIDAQKTGHINEVKAEWESTNELNILVNTFLVQAGDLLAKIAKG